jgi:hypothetical protein
MLISSRTTLELGLRYGPEAKDAVLLLIPLKELSQFYAPESHERRFFYGRREKVQRMLIHRSDVAS